MNRHYVNNSRFFNPDDYYNNTYSLKQNSKAYDAQNTNSQTFNSEGYIPRGKVEEKATEVHKDEKNRRIITRASLYEDPDSFYERYYGQTLKTDQDWTQKHWKKAMDLDADEPSTSVQNKVGSMAPYQRSNKIQKKLEVMLKQPVTLSKAETMMQKMGWQGGALGRSGVGIVEPIKPNAHYAVKTLGFGQSDYQPVKKIKTIDNNKNIFTTNLLLFILEFVKDDTEAEVLFDSCLWKEERKWVHNMVNDVINAEEPVDCDTLGQMDIVQRIHEHNCFVLSTQSEGIVPNRRLCLFKEAPPNMYLITPADLKDEIPEEEEEEKEVDTVTDKTNTNTKSDTITNKTLSKGVNKVQDKKINNQSSSQTNKVTDIDRDKLLSCQAKKVIEKSNKDEPISNEKNEVSDKKSEDEAKSQADEETETNPFLLSITKHMRKNCDKLKEQLEEISAYERIVDYFKEFSEQDCFTELRFLGSFSDSEVLELDRFLDDVRKCIDDDFNGVSEKIVAAFKDNYFDVHEDVNGFNVLYRVEKSL